MGCNLRILHTKQDLLVVGLWRLVMGMALLLQDNLLGGVLSHQSADDTGEEDHHDHTVEHIVVDKILTRGHFEAHAHHNHGDGTSRMGRGEAEHHVSIGLRQSEDETGDIGCDSLSKGAEEDDEEYHPDDVDAREEGAHVDEHAHTNQEVGDEQGITDKLDAVHQGRDVGDVSVEDQSGEEGAEDAFEADE